MQYLKPNKFYFNPKNPLLNLKLTHPLKFLIKYQ